MGAWSNALLSCWARLPITGRSRSESRLGIPAEEKSRLRDCLYESTHMLSSVQVETYEFYRIPFLDVLDLVRARKCFLSSGYAYIPSVDFISVLSSKFRDNLSHALVMTARQLPALEEDERLFHMLKGLHNTYTGDDYSINKNTTGVRPEELDSVKTTPCFSLLMMHSFYFLLRAEFSSKQ
ncbi:unnamed protein product [Timema podura]|uniref:Uncharacterized protein n=1 Tax=Timema podura TaxID=61482 RepID=A0ABN7PN63_TIMPD|nr:unnamed protein product [Timema podura]